MINLNIDNLEKFLDDFDIYTLGYNTIIHDKRDSRDLSYSTWINMMLKHFFDVEFNQNYIYPLWITGSMIKYRFGDDFQKRRFFENLTIFEVRTLYPTVISILIRNKSFKFETQEIETLYLFIFDNIKKIENQNSDLYFKCRFFLIAFYGFIGKSPIIKGDIQMIVDYLKKIFGPLYEKYEDIIYVDSDIMFIKDYEKYQNVIEDQITEAGLKFETFKTDVIIERVKKYAFLKNFQITKFKGYKQSDKEKIDEEFKIKRRNLKVNKILK